MRRSGLRWNIWQIQLGVFKNAKDDSYLESVKKDRSNYEKLFRDMKTSMESYEDPLMANPLLQKKEEVRAAHADLRARD